MLSNQVLLKIISDIKGITGAQTSIWNFEGECLASTDNIEEVQMHLVQDYLCAELEELEELKEMNGYYLRSINIEETPEYILLFEGLEGDAEVLSALCASQIENMSQAYKEPLSKTAFLHGVLTGTMDISEMLAKADRVHIKKAARRVVYVIESKKEGEEIVANTLKSLYVTGITDFVVEIDKNHIVLIKEWNNTAMERDIDYLAKTIVDTISAETMLSIRVAYGSLAEELPALEKSYSEARMALEVGKSFYPARMVLAYKQLGIGRLIHQLPDKLCQEFLDEILSGNGLAQFEEETMLAARCFFENNLNISETARQLYVHRNTLMYRLEKIQKKTGLDVRVFDDAISFKLAMMVSDHVQFTKVK